MKIDFEKFDEKKKIHMESLGRRSFGSRRSGLGIGGEA